MVGDGRTSRVGRMLEISDCSPVRDFLDLQGKFISATLDPRLSQRWRHSCGVQSGPHLPSASFQTSLAPLSAGGAGDLEKEMCLESQDESGRSPCSGQSEATGKGRISQH